MASLDSRVFCNSLTHYCAFYVFVAPHQNVIRPSLCRSLLFVAAQPAQTTLSITGGGQKIICSLRLRTYPLLSHFQNDGATVECSTVVAYFSRYSQQFYALELKRCGRKESEEGIEAGAR